MNRYKQELCCRLTAIKIRHLFVFHLPQNAHFPVLTMQILENIGEPILLEETINSATWKWTIKNISKYFKIGRESILSHEFSIQKPGHRYTHWKLKLYPNGQEGFPEGESITINLVNLDPYEFRIGYKFGILNAKNEKAIELNTMQTTFHRSREVTPGVQLLKREEILQNHNPFIVDDSLNVYCKIYFEPARNFIVNGQALIFF